MESGRAAVLAAKLLSCCLSLLSKKEVKSLWTKSGLHWDDLGMHREDVEEFLDRQVKGGQGQ